MKTLFQSIAKIDMKSLKYEMLMRIPWC